ncbi:MAG: 50S ribosomal protein L17 [Bacteroidales bacterium]|nr:50S ribosomal protein L17 [Bacteroidales bacterium]MDD4669500.1 50S ribosomal protein L17 [Bacteroidales bacterium]
MRHNKSINHLGRQSGHRKAMLANMASSLILHKKIETTLAKAKALRMYVEPLITKSKEDTTHSRRIVFSYLKQKEAVSELFRVVAPKIADRPGGYTRIIKNGFRLGDTADMAIMELVDFNESAVNAGTPAKDAAKKPSTRRGGAKKAVADAAAPAAEAAETTETEATAKKAPAKKAPAKKAVNKPAAPKATGKVNTKAAPAKKVSAPRKTGK